jgi:hypothetical protein
MCTKCVGVSKSSKTVHTDQNLLTCPLQNSSLVKRHTDPSGVATVITRAGSSGLEAYQGHSAIPPGSPPLRQNGNPLAAALSLERGRSRKGPNLVSKVDEEV